MAATMNSARETNQSQIGGITMNKADNLISILPTGKDNAIGYQTLMERLGLSSRRHLYSVIHDARNAGAVILSDNNGGYYIPDTSTAAGQLEISEFRRRITNMGNSTLNASRSAEEALKGVK